MPMKNPADYLKKKQETTDDLRKEAETNRSFLAWIRFGAIALAILFGYLAIDQHAAWWLILLVAALAAFGRIVIWDVNNNAQIRRLKELTTLINQEADFIATGKPIPGNDTTVYLDLEHPYAYDLDIFGKGSLYAALNRAHSEQGRALLRRRLAEVPTGRDTIDRALKALILVIQDVHIEEPCLLQASICALWLPAEGAGASRKP